VQELVLQGGKPDLRRSRKSYFWSWLWPSHCLAFLTLSSSHPDLDICTGFRSYL